MLSEIKHIIDNPEDIPAIPRASAQYLKARLNPAYLLRTGELDNLRQSGFSEQAILGFIEGVSAIIEIIEIMEKAQNAEPWED